MDSQPPAYTSNTYEITANIPAAQMISTIDVTTAAVVASPTADALSPDCIPRRHPDSATRTPYTDWP